VKLFKHIISFSVVFVILISTIGINITEHSCNSCGLYEEEISFINIQHKHHNDNHEKHIHGVEELDCSTNETCCSNNSLTEHHTTNTTEHNCCDFKNTFLKIINIFTPSTFFKVFKANILSTEIVFIEDLLSINKRTTTIFNFPTKILQSELILQFICKLTL